MADKTEQARTRRTAARDRRRASVEEPFEEMDQAAREQAEKATSPNSDLAGAAAKVVGTAFAAALLGAVGGAAKALLERRGGEEPETSEQPEQESDGEGASEDTARAESAPEQEDEDETEEQPEEPAEEQPAAAPEGRGVDEEEHSQGDEELEDETPEPAAANEDGGTSHVQGVSADEGAEIVKQARQQLEGLLGTEAERVSGLERVDGGWSVMLEVVEVSRIPESTDVLATYELSLDDDRKLVSLARKRRYRRSQVDDAS